MSDGELYGWIGGIGGTLIGVVGGVIGTYCSIRNVKSPRERSFMIKAAVGFWVFAVLFVATLLLIRSPWRFVLFAPFGIVLPVVIYYGNKKQMAIRQQEQGTSGMEQPAPVEPPQNESAQETPSQEAGT